MEQLPLYECSICGRDGGPVEGCTTCHGNKSYIANRQHTLSDEQAGRVKTSKRYGLDGQVGPHIVVVPGSETFGTN